MKTYKYSVTLNGEIVGEGTLRMFTDRDVYGKLSRIYGKKANGFSFQVYRVM